MQKVKNNMPIIGGITWKGGRATAYGDLFDLDNFDQSEYKHVDLKPGERLFRYTTDSMLGYYLPLIKVNEAKGKIYFLRENDLDRAFFETKGIKARVKIY